jgi:hypothetical protein
MSRGYGASARSASVGLALVLVAGTALVRGGVDVPVLAVAAVIAAAALALSPGRSFALRKAQGERTRGHVRGERTRSQARGEPTRGQARGERTRSQPRGERTRDGGHARRAATKRERTQGAATATVPVLVLGLLGVLGVIGLQLVPLPAGVIAFVSPRTAEVLDGALAPLGLWPSWRPLSLAPAATALELAKAAVFLAVVATGAVLARSERRRDRLLVGLALSGVVVSVAYYGAALLGVSPLVAPQVTFVNTNHLAGFFLLTAWPALGLALRSRGAGRVGWLVAFAFVGSGVFLSLSRAGIAAFFVAAGVFAILRLRASGFDRLRDREGIRSHGARAPEGRQLT